MGKSRESREESFLFLWKKNPILQTIYMVRSMSHHVMAMKVPHCGVLDQLVSATSSSCHVLSRLRAVSVTCHVMAISSPHRGELVPRRLRAFPICHVARSQATTSSSYRVVFKSSKNHIFRKRAPFLHYLYSYIGISMFYKFSFRS